MANDFEINKSVLWDLPEIIIEYFALVYFFIQQFLLYGWTPIHTYFVAMVGKKQILIIMLQIHGK